MRGARRSRARAAGALTLTQPPLGSFAAKLRYPSPVEGEGN